MATKIEGTRFIYPLYSKNEPPGTQNGVKYNSRETCFANRRNREYRTAMDRSPEISIPSLVRSFLRDATEGEGVLICNEEDRDTQEIQKEDGERKEEGEGRRIDRRRRRREKEREGGRSHFET